MLYTELLHLWNEAVQAVDGRDWAGALAKLRPITEHTSRTLFLASSAHLALGQLDLSIRALDQVLAKDERLAVGFFQRAGVLMLANRPEEALSDCIWAQKHMRENPVIDYRQLGLRYKLYSWQVLYNAAAVHCSMGQWGKAQDILLAVAQERGGRVTQVDQALDSVYKREVFAPLLVPEGEVFRPRKQDIDQLEKRDFLGKAKVITSLIPNDDFGGFEPLREQKPGFYEPQVEPCKDSHYMRVKSAYKARGAGELNMAAGALVFVYSDDAQDGLATVIYDGKKGLLPNSLLEPVDVKKDRSRKRHSVPSGIPMPPAMKPPERPQTTTSPSQELPPSYTSITQSNLSPQRASPAGSPRRKSLPTPQLSEAEEPTTVVVKVHFTYTVALNVPLETPYKELQGRIARKLGQSATQLRLRHRQHGSQALTPLDEEESISSLAESGRVTLWCQTENVLSGRTMLYQMVALYDYAAQGPEDLEFSEGDTIDILSEVNEEWLEGHTAGNIGIFPRCFAYRDSGDAAGAEATSL